MAEQVIRSIQEILNELFSGKNSALEKFAKVRMTKYEIEMWAKSRRGNCKPIPLSFVPNKAKLHFSNSFLGGAKLANLVKDKNNTELINKGLEKLGYAYISCNKRCARLVQELNEALVAKGLPRVKEIDRFLDWLTFSYEPRLDSYGIPIYEDGYNIPLLNFDSDRNRKEFWGELQLLLKSKKMISMQNLCRIVLEKRKISVPI